MAQGFKNGGVYRTDLSFPSIIAKAMGNSSKFESRSFSAQAGIPINIEVLVRGLEEKFGNEINLYNSIPAGREMYRTLRRIKSYWDGRLTSLKIDRTDPYHNQGIWGFSISDSWLIDELFCRNYLQSNQARYSVFDVLPDNAMYTTARLVLNPSFSPKIEKNSMVDNIRQLQDDGGIENLIACIGHNNIVGAVTKLKIIYSKEDDVEKPYPERSCTVFRPEHFERELRILYRKISKFDIKNVFVPTIPYVTIPPAIRGVNTDQSNSFDGYFDYYARFWIWDEDFDPEKHPHLTRDNAILLDQIVDEYNQIIKKVGDEFDYTVVPIGRYVRAAARRRHRNGDIQPFPEGFITALKENPKTSYLVNNNNETKISTDYIRLEEDTRRIMQGGIFSLDGLHPSTIGYGLIANIYKQSMQKHGVKFEHPIDWDFVIENETLITDPPALLGDLRKLLRLLSLGRQERLTFLGKNIFEQILEAFTSGPEVESSTEAE